VLKLNKLLPKTALKTLHFDVTSFGFIPMLRENFIDIRITNLVQLRCVIFLPFIIFKLFYTFTI